MELSEELFDEIHRYLNGQGTPRERTAFEDRMRTDAALAGEVEAQRRIRHGLKANEYKNIFKDIHARLENEGALWAGDGQDNRDDRKTVPLTPESRFTIRWPYIAAAAAVLLAIGLVWYFNLPPESTPIASDTPVSENPATPDTARPLPPPAKPDTSKIGPPKQKQQQTPPARVDKTDFFAGYFNETPELESPFSKEKLGLSPSSFRQWQSDTARVHQGIRYLAKHDAALALQELKQVETSRFPQVKGVAEWYIALAYLQQDDLKNCVEQLKKVAADAGNPNSKQAAELLAKIQ